MWSRGGMDKKPVIYQLLPRLFGNTNRACIPNGSIQENGAGKFNDINSAALTAIKRLNVTHIWLTGILAHATTTDYTPFGLSPVDPSLVKGKAGSPYAIRDYYDVSPDLAVEVPNRMAEFTALVERCHTQGLKVIIDFIPNHVFRQYHSGLGKNDNPQIAFSPQNNFYYLPDTCFLPPVPSSYREKPAKVTGNDCFVPNPSINDWYETVKLNYGVDMQQGGVSHFDPIPDTWHQMREVLSFWAAKGVDGFRCDMAEMVPDAFWAWVIPQIKATSNHPLFIAEIYRPELYRTFLKSGFDYLYDKVGLYDTLKAVLRGERPAADITHCWQQLGDLQPYMLNFLENHDEQRIASDFFMGDGFKALPALLVSMCLHNAPFMLYMGQEFGERGMDGEGFSGVDGRTSIFDYWSVGSLKRFCNDGKFNTEKLTDSERRLYSLYSQLCAVVAAHPALATGDTYDLVYANRHHNRFNPDKHFAFLRHLSGSEGEVLLIAVNFCDQPADIEVIIPPHAFEHLRIPTHENKPVTIPLQLSAWGAGILKILKHPQVRIVDHNGIADLFDDGNSLIDTTLFQFGIKTKRG